MEKIVKLYYWVKRLCQRRQTMEKTAKTYDWVKRIGQWHLTRPGEYQTICGKPMLGNNFTKVIPEDERQKCPKCHGLGEERI